MPRSLLIALAGVLIALAFAGQPVLAATIFCALIALVGTAAASYGFGFTAGRLAEHQRHAPPEPVAPTIAYRPEPQVTTTSLPYDPRH